MQSTAVRAFALRTAFTICALALASADLTLAKAAQAQATAAASASSASPGFSPAWGSVGPRARMLYPNGPNGPARRSPATAITDGTYPVIGSACDPILSPSSIPMINDHGSGWVADVDVHNVYWPAGPGEEPVDPLLPNLLGDFFTDYFASPYWNALMPQYLLDDFDDFVGVVASNTALPSLLVTDPYQVTDPFPHLDTTDFAPELRAQQKAGVLPMPKADGTSLYYIHLPPGVMVGSPPATIGPSCSAGDEPSGPEGGKWCAFHHHYLGFEEDSIVLFMYAVQPDYRERDGSDCHFCGQIAGVPDATAFDRYTTTIVEELTERITDSYAGGWRNRCLSSGEQIGDICATQNFLSPRRTYSEGAATCPSRWGYTTLYSNSHGGCLAVDTTTDSICTTTTSTTSTSTSTSTSTTTTLPSNASCPLAPRIGCEEVAKASLLSLEKGAGKEKLKLSWTKVATETEQVDLGDPVGTASAVLLCMYDDTDALLVELRAAREAGEICGKKPCWKALSSKGYAYVDTAAAQDGIKTLLFKGGAAGKGIVKAFGLNNAKKGTPTLPIGVAAALSGNASPTVQMIASSGLCVSATLTDVKTDSTVLYKAKK